MGSTIDPLKRSVLTLPRVGPRRAEQLARLGIHSLGDLLHHFPVRHDDLTRRLPVSELPEGRPVSLHGEVVSLDLRRGRRSRWTAVLQVEGERVSLVWFSDARRPPPVQVGWIGFATGSLRRYGGPQLVHPRVHRTDDRSERPPGHNRLRPVYRSTEGLDGEALAKWVDATLEIPDLGLERPWPEGALRHGEGRTILAAYRAIHFPETLAERTVALATLGEAELYLFCLRQLARLARREARRAPVIEVTPALDARIRGRFPYRLTAAQDRVVQELVEDLGRGYPMARLVQGEVGSGKTAVALYAALAAVAAGVQVAILAPTAPLATQHHETFLELLEGSQVRPELLIAGSDPGKEIRESLESGACPLVIGTHALLSDDTRFLNLGLVIVDEEQRFGVEQRWRLAQKGEGTHRLHLSATPIPRTLALALVGDFEWSTIAELPPGRIPPRTRQVESSRLEEAAEFIAGEIAAGHKVLFVVPRIDEDSPAGDPAGEEPGGSGVDAPDGDGSASWEAAPSVVSLVERLRASPLGRFPIGELHGRLPAAEQLRRMLAFRRGETPILVATSIVEVGLDVPGLTVLWIEGADYFGLSQLHQLRGRLGRRGEESWCFFTASAAREIGDGDGPDPRLEAFRQHGNGFTLAEEDLRLRGEGEAIGVRQSGFLPFRLRHPREDLQALSAIRERARKGREGGLDPLWARIGGHFAPGEEDLEGGENGGG
jgi:ATP-dependent DNA helicase RecG